MGEQFGLVGFTFFVVEQSVVLFGRGLEFDGLVCLRFKSLESNDYASLWFHVAVSDFVLLCLVWFWFKKFCLVWF